MATQGSAAQPDPGLIFQEMNAYQRTMALKGAVDLDLFTHIDDGASTAAELAARTAASERGIRTLCDFLTVNGILTKKGNAYGLTPSAKVFLSKHSPAYLGAMANFLANSRTLANFQDVAATVRRGGAAQPDTALAPDHPIWVEFARSMAGLAQMLAQETAAVVRKEMPAGPAKALDIAAGHGLYGISIAQAFPAAQIVGLDWKNVLEVALENARKAGVAGRYQTIAGSAFEADFGTGYDLVLVPNFCHHFDVPTNVQLLRKIRAALKPGGRIGIVDFIPNEDRVSPPIPAAFGFVMLNNTPAGDVYTFPEYKKMLEEAGFSSIALHEFAHAPQCVVMGTA